MNLLFADMMSSSKPTSVPSSANAAKKRPLEMSLVSCERAARGVWLVKVPKYLSEVWQKNEGAAIGSLITGQQVVFRSNPELAVKEKAGPKVIVQPSSSKFAPSEDLKPLGKKSKPTPAAPTEHSFLIKDLNQQTMAVLAEDKSHLEEESDTQTGKLTIEGRVVKRAECQPPATLDYMKMKISQIEKISQPKHTVKQMDKAVVKFKPVAQHQENLAKEKSRKENARAVRMDRNDVSREIFKAFEKHQYYRLADLQRITNQPANSVKEILTTIANYSATQPHKNMWELKPEYRDYGKTGGKAEGSGEEFDDSE